jgi:hypothetical protein
METKKEITDALLQMKKQIEEMNNQKAQVENLFNENEKLDQTNAHLFDLLKYMIDQNKRTTMLLGTISDALSRVEGEVSHIEYEEAQKQQSQHENPAAEPKKQIAVSSVDKSILQLIQLSQDGMACADDIKRKMNYKGRNAASARLNRLHTLGLLERYQVGKNVYYKYDAGKTTNLLIVSPSQ